MKTFLKIAQNCKNNFKFNRILGKIKLSFWGILGEIPGGVGFMWRESV